jgi:hypothetical protein
LDRGVEQRDARQRELATDLAQVRAHKRVICF